MSNLIERQAAIDAVKKNTFRLTFAEEQNCEGHVAWSACAVYSDVIEGILLELPSAQSDSNKYEYHYDHTDCTWYRPEARNRCPATCAQYRDGWNDAMNYIFRDGKGYRPYMRDEKYGE